MNFEDRLNQIGANQAAQHQAKRNVDALRAPASRNIRELLTTTAKYLAGRKIPVVEIRGIKPVAEQYEVKRLFRSAETHTYHRAVDANYGRGWVIGEVGNSPDEGYRNSDPLIINTRGELLRGVTDTALASASQTACQRRFPQPSKVSDEPMDIVPLYKEIEPMHKQLKGSHALLLQQGLPKREFFSVTPSGRPVFVDYVENGDYGYDWWAYWLDDFLDDKVALVVKKYSS